MKPRWLFAAAILVAAGLLCVRFFGVVPVYLAGASAVAVAAIAWAFKRWWNRRIAAGASQFEVMVAKAASQWTPTRRARLEELVAELAGPAAAAHALRVTALCDLLAEQLAIGPQESADLSVAATLHVLPRMFGGDSPEELPCGHTPWALATTANLVSAAVSGRAGRIVGEFCERWDGAGLPAALIGEESSLGGRVLAATCAFDRASSDGLEYGLEVIRNGSGDRFDPVVVGELQHLFREPFQPRKVA